MRSVTVVVPIFNAADALANCLSRLARYVPQHWRVLLVDDASTDPRVGEVIGSYNAKPRWSVRARERNLGFVAGCNEALQHIASADDVLLLNTDTLPTPGSLLNMALALDDCPSAATVTPWSNNAEICSLPSLCQAAPVPDDPDRLAFRLLRHRPSYPELPTGVGFCMLIRRRVIEELGELFDAESFPRGYGEENDFCRRAVEAGYCNVLCDNAYVPHLGGASFGPLGLKPDADSMQRLLKKHPDYEAVVSAYIQADPLAELRDQVLAQLGDAAPRIYSETTTAS